MTFVNLESMKPPIEFRPQCCTNCYPILHKPRGYGPLISIEMCQNEQLS